jgi:pyridoxine kinase
MGQTTSAEEFAQIVEGLRSKSLLKSDYVLSGYMRSPDLLRATGSLVEELQRANPSLSYFLDPVMGDNGRMYVPEELTNVYKTVLLPLATVITPNAFEAERLSGIPITCEESAAAACRMLHSLGPQTVVITSLNGPNLIKKDETEGRVLLASTMLAGEQRMYRVTTPSEKGNYGGCGDLFAACLLGHMHRSRGDFASSLELACSSTHAVISRTAQERPGGEMCVIQSQEEICRPMKRFQAEAVVCEDLAIAGIIYDMDGTLTLPGHIDFDRMRTRIGLGPGTDILEEIRKLPADQQEAAVAIVEEEEMAALERLELQPGLHEVTELIRGWRVRCAIATKNMGAAVDFFMDRTGLSHEIFAPLITRDFPFTKPDPRVATAICEQWGIPAHQTLFVG